MITQRQNGSLFTEIKNNIAADIVNNDLGSAPLEEKCKPSPR